MADVRHWVTPTGAFWIGWLCPQPLPLTIIPKEPEFRNKIYSALKRNPRERYEKVTSVRPSGLWGQGPDPLLAPWRPALVAKGLQKPGAKLGA